MTESSTERRRLLSLIFMSTLGLVGWGFIVGATYVSGFGPESPAQPDALSFALFLVVIVAARAMAFHPVPETVVSLDAGFYVAAVTCLGSVTSGRLVAIALTLDSVSRLFGRERRPRGEWPHALAYVLYFGGMSGALLMATGWVFGLDGLYVLAGVPDLVVVGKVLGVGSLFLVAHYTLQGLRLGLAGLRPKSYLRGMAIPGLLAEAALLPLAAVVVFLYHPDHPLKFALLGVTYVLINYAFNRLSATGAKLRERVSELETLNATSRRLASSLQLRQLVETVARETMTAIPEAEILALTHRGFGDEDKQLVVDYFDRERDVFERFTVQARGATGWVLENDSSLYVSDLARSDLGVELHTDAGVRSWMGVPIEIYDNNEGVLAIQSRKRDAFHPDRLRLLEAIGAQAAVALQNARLYELAMVDGLTRLFVRRYFDARLEEEIQRSRRFDTVFSVVMMDIDDFKQLNDTHGHIVGDKFLRGIADIVRRQMRGVDTAARYGGEEFAMILPRTPMVEALNVAERLRSQIEDFRVSVDDKVLGATASFGIASYPESGATGSESLVRLADRALYRAKRSGKNRVELYWADDEESRRPPLAVVPVEESREKTPSS